MFGVMEACEGNAKEHWDLAQGCISHAERRFEVEAEKEDLRRMMRASIRRSSSTE